MESLAILINEKVVIDLHSPYVCLGKLKRLEKEFLVLSEADLHDLRDSPTTRENYVISSKISGIKKNRKEVWVKFSDMVAISKLSDILEGDD